MACPYGDFFHSLSLSGALGAGPSIRRLTAQSTDPPVAAHGLSSPWLLESEIWNLRCGHGPRYAKARPAEENRQAIVAIWQIS